jgi:hypothetical protein
LARGHCVQIVRDGEVVHSGFLDKLGEQSGAGEVSEPSWVDLNDCLNRAWLYPNPGSDSGQGRATHDVRGGYVSSAVRGYVNANIGPGALQRRQAPGVVLGRDPQAGVWLETPAAARFENALEFLRSLAMANGCVWEWDTDDRTHTFRVRQIVDRSADVQFSADLNNLGAGGFTVTAPTATEVHVFGPGEGSEQMIFRVTTPESEAQAATWGRPFVAVLSGTSIVKADEAVYAAEIATRDAAEVAAGAADDYAKYTNDLAEDAEKKAVDWAEDEDLSQAEKDQAAKEARAARVVANEAAANYNNVYAVFIAAEAAAEAAIVVADRDNTFHTLHAQARQLLSESGETVEMTYEVVAGSFEWGRDLFLGDLVSVKPPGFSAPVVLPVREAFITWNTTDGWGLKLTVGDFAATSGTSAAQQMREITSVVRKLQTR